MFVLSRKALLLALVAATALLAPVAATTDSMADPSSAADQMTEPYTSDTAEEESDEPVDSGLECSDDFAADGQCDDVNNSAACGYDGGDCCLCTCNRADFNCGGNFNCIDPDAECVDDDDGEGGEMTSLPLETDDETEEDEGTDGADAETAADSAMGSTPHSFTSAGLAAAAGAAVVLAGWGL